jgi:hypothetical protein
VIVLVIGLIVALAAFVGVECISLWMRIPLKEDSAVFLLVIVTPCGVLVFLLGGILLVIGWGLERWKKPA